MAKFVKNNKTIKDELFLCFIERLYSRKKEEHSFRLYFTKNINDVVGESWELCGEGIAEPPYEDYIDKLLTISTSKIDMELLTENDFFSYNHGANKVIALAWEYSEDEIPYKMLTFHFGEILREVEEKLFEREIKMNVDEDLTDEEDDD